MKKYYQILDLEEGASKAEIEKRCQELLKEYDPKDNDNQEFFKEEYEKVQEAYKALITSALLKSPDKKPKVEPVHTESSANEDEAKEGEKTRVDAQKVPALGASFTKKNILLILIVLGVLVAILIKIGYSQGSVVYDDLTDNGMEESINPVYWHGHHDRFLHGQIPLVYFEGVLFNGVAFAEYSNGQLEVKTNFKDGEKDGLETRWHENGQLSREVNWKDGERDGLETRWHENGQLEEKSNFKNGNYRDRVRRVYYSSGQLEIEANYTDGKLDGFWKWWYEDGQLRHVVRYSDGKRWGVNLTYYSNGQLDTESYYSNDKLNGLLRCWFENGRPQREVYWSDGQSLGLEKYWDENGQYWEENGR